MGRAGSAPLEGAREAPRGSFLGTRLRSFGFAFAGLRSVFVTQPNAWIHALATVAVVALGVFLDVGRYDWCWLVFAIALVWIAEALNTAVEALADASVPEPHPLVRRAKDSGAAAVLLAALAASLIGFLVLGPPLLRRLIG